MLYEILSAAKNGDSESQMFLFTKFQPTLKRLARQLHTEDADSEMTLVFFEILAKIDITSLRAKSDGVIVTYISRSIYHGYCEIIRSRKDTPLLVDIEDEEIADDEELSVILSVDFLLSYENVLTRKEIIVLRLIFEKDLSCADAARLLGVTRQNVSKLKRSALQKVKMAV